MRELAAVQELDLVGSGALAAEALETQLDKLAAQVQTVREMLARTPRFGIGSALSEVALPEPKPASANRLLGVTAAGDGFEFKAPAELSLQTVSGFAATLLDDPDAAAARATLGIGSTVDLNLLATDVTGGATNDFVPFVDVSEASASNKVTLLSLFYNFIGNLTASATPDMATWQVMARDPTGVIVNSVLARYIGAGRQTVWVPAGAMTVRTTGGPASGTVETATHKVMIRTLDFDAAVAEYAQFAMQMPKGWNEGTVSGVFVWSHGAASSNFNVVWGFQGLALSDDDAIDSAFGAAQTVTDSGGTANDLYRSAESAAVTLGGTPAEGDVALFQVFRDAANGADTLAVDARLHGVALFYTTNANTDA